MGENELSLNYLETALEREVGHTFTDIKCGYEGPIYDDLRNDPRFNAIMKKAELLLGQVT